MSMTTNLTPTPISEDEVRDAIFTAEVEQCETESIMDIFGFSESEARIYHAENNAMRAEHLRDAFCENAAIGFFGRM